MSKAIKGKLTGPSRAEIAGMHKAFRDFRRNNMANMLFLELDEKCRNILLDAVVENRKRNQYGHDYTGNLVNSIVVILFCREWGEQYAYYAYDREKNPISREMSAKTTRGGKRKRAYHFRPDWQGAPDSSYSPEVETDRSTGPSDARNFVSTWMPSSSKWFEICVAYTSEYATWVEEHHKTTGYVASVAFTKQMMTRSGFKTA